MPGGTASAVWGVGAEGSFLHVCLVPVSWPGGHSCAYLHLSPPTSLLLTYPFADQVVGEVSGQHVRAKRLCHVLTVNLGMPASEWYVLGTLEPASAGPSKAPGVEGTP